MKYLILLLLINYIICYKNIVILILGCHIDYIQYDRIETALQYVSNLDDNEYNITWFLTGGNKHQYIIEYSEAYKMNYKYNLNAIIEDKATNTAENFVYFKLWLEKQTINYDAIIVSTSKFHSKRSQILADKILKKEIIWIFGKKSFSYCYTDEIKHMYNIYNDTINAIDLYNKLK